MSSAFTEFAERPRPHNSEGERAILGAILLDNLLMNEAMEGLNAEDFYIPSHKKIFMAMVELSQRGSEIDPILIGEELRRRGELESVGGISGIANLTYGIPRLLNLESYVKLIRGKHLLRLAIAESHRIIEDAYDEQDEPEVILDRAEHGIFQIAEARMREGLEHIKPIIERLLDKIQAMEGRATLLTGLGTGFTEFDSLTSGLQAADLIIIAARPSMGKTSFALNLAQNIGVGSQAVIAIFSVEMSKEALAMRMLCSESNVDAQRFRNGFLSKPEWVKIGGAIGSLGNTKIFLDDTPAITVLEMRAKVRRLLAEQKRLDLIIVDYLQLMSGSNKRFESRQQEVSLISRELKGLAKEMNVPLVALSQLSRGPESRADHIPQLADLRESGALEQDADLVAFIYREEVYKSAEERQMMPEDKKNLAQIILAKQRNGPTGTIELRFVPSSMRFDNLYRSE